MAFAPRAGAHFVELPGAGNGLDRAIYLGETPADEHSTIPAHQGARCYSVSLHANQTTRIRLDRAPHAFEDGTAPQLAIAGPGIRTSTTLPPGISIPTNTSAIVLPGFMRDSTTYEFPQEIATSTLLQFDFTAPQTATYTLIILAPDASGAYGLHLDEPSRWSLYNLLGITDTAGALHTWEGQRFFDDWGPTFVAIPFGLVLAFAISRRMPRTRGVFGGICVIGALFLTNTTLHHFYQAWWHHRNGLPWAALRPSFVSGLEGLGLIIATFSVYTFSTARPSWLRLLMPLVAAAALLTWNGGEYGVVVLALTSVIPGEGTATKTDAPPTIQARSKLVQERLSKERP